MSIATITKFPAKDADGNQLTISAWLYPPAAPGFPAETLYFDQDGRILWRRGKGIYQLHQRGNEPVVMIYAEDEGVELARRETAGHPRR